jgi:tRNA(Ile)-lysidine synthase
MSLPLQDAEVDALFAPVAAAGQPAVWVLAVSGGADSIAMLHLAADWARRHAQCGISLHVATVDHGLRPEAGAEAEAVGGVAMALGLPHTILSWTGEKPATRLQEAARAARYALLRRLAEALPAQPARLLTAHTADDQAETLLMRLARGSGVDGLASMRPVRMLGQVQHHRPLLGVTKAQLLAQLSAGGITWLDDPSNTNDRFERVRIRRLLPVLAEHGIGAAAMALSAHRLGRAGAALDLLTSALWNDAVRATGSGPDGALIIDRARLASVPAELRIRLLMRAITTVGAQREPPLLAQIEALAAALDHPAARGQTLGACMITPMPREIRVTQERRRIAQST